MCSVFPRSRKPSATAGVRGRKELRQHREARCCQKQRNKHLQTTLIEAPRWRPETARAGHALRQGETESNANRATLQCRASSSPTWLPWIAVKRVPYSRKRKPHRPRSRAAGTQGRISSTRGLPGLPLTRLGEGAQAPMLPLISFETGGKTQTQSSVKDHSLV